MVCPSCSTTAPAPAPAQVRGENLESIVSASFSTAGEVSLGSTSKIFIDLAYTLPFAASSADAYITSLISKNFQIGFEPTYFQIPKIYSAADNLINGKYTEEVKVEGTKIITTYKIPYSGELKEEIASVVTYFDTTSQILFYEIPRELSYNSKDQASVALATKDDQVFTGKLIIPVSWYSALAIPSCDNCRPADTTLKLSIGQTFPDGRATTLGPTATVSVSDTYCEKQCTNYCDGNHPNNCPSGYNYCLIECENYRNKPFP